MPNRQRHNPAMKNLINNYSIPNLVIQAYANRSICLGQFRSLVMLLSHGFRALRAVVCGQIHAWNLRCLPDAMCVESGRDVQRP